MKNLLFTAIVTFAFISNCLFGQKPNGLINSATFKVPDSTVINSYGGVAYLSDTTYKLPVDNQQWQYIAITKDNANNGKIYKNGQLVFQGKFQNLSYYWNRLILGALYYTSYKCWYNGQIDEVRISNTVRSATDFANYYSSNAEFATDANTIGLWHFNQTTGTTLTSTTGPTGSLTNATWNTQGKFGSCLNFNGTNAYASIPITIPTSNMTFEFWIKPNAIQNDVWAITWYGMYDSGFILSRDTIKTNYTWSTGAKGNTVTVNPKTVPYVWVTNGKTTDTVFFNSQPVKTIIVHDTVKIATTAVPTAGLVAYYPFNGNANDASGNNFNGVVNGATLTTDRFGNANSAYQFNNNYIQISNSGNIDFTNGITFCAWIYTSQYHLGGIVDKMDFTSGFRISTRSSNTGSLYNSKIWAQINGYNLGNAAVSTPQYTLNSWQLIVGTYNPTDDSLKLYNNGILVGKALINQSISNTNNIVIGRSTPSGVEYFNGVLDDIRIYNRALTQQEINYLNYESPCVNKVTVYDTIHASVTDTLVINAVLTGITASNNTNIIKVYPSPTKDHITINFGNVASMNGYTVKIVNSVGQTVYTSTVNQQTSFIDLNSWSGKGVYIINIIDPSNTVIESRKIVLE